MRSFLLLLLLESACAALYVNGNDYLVIYIELADYKHTVIVTIFKLL